MLFKDEIMHFFHDIFYVLCPVETIFNPWRSRFLKRILQKNMYKKSWIFKITPWNRIIFSKKSMKNQDLLWIFDKCKKKAMLRLYASAQSFLKGIEPSTFGLSPILYPWATGTWGFVCLFLLEVGDKELESCRIRKCIWSICMRKGSSKDQSWQVSSYLSIAESRSSSPEAHE